MPLNPIKFIKAIRFAAGGFHGGIIMLKNFNTKFSSRVAAGMEISCNFAIRKSRFRM